MTLVVAELLTNLEWEHMFLQEVGRAYEDGRLDAILRAPGGTWQLSYPFGEGIILREGFEQTFPRGGRFGSRPLLLAAPREQNE